MESLKRYLDFSGALQKSTSSLLQKDNEVSAAINARFNKVLGGATRRDGYEQVGGVLDTDRNVNFLDAYFHKSGDMTLASSNNAATTATNLKRLIGSQWTTLSSDFPYNAKLYLKNYLDKAFIVGYSEDSGTFATTHTIDNTGTVSDTTSLESDIYGAPKAKYIAEYKDKIYMANVEVGGKKYPNRVYQSSAPTDAITYVNGDFKVNGALQLTVDSVRYLKPGMRIDIYGENSNKKKADSITIISVDKANNIISFSATDLDLLDRDEIYLENRKDKSTILWNTDYPNTESADFIEIPTGKNEDPNITGIYIYYNRLWVATNHSLWKWDGANLVCVTKDHGTTSNESMCEIGGNLVMFEPTGYWAYTDQSRMPQLLSRGIQDLINSINPYFYNKVKSIISGDEYRSYVGELMDAAGRTTSTSTSSTSTSVTTYSTSSTSTSSTSTSSTSTSETTVTTSTSSTSSSTSSTSLSTSSTSLSTSSTSTSSTTVASTAQSTILTYNFSMNAWNQDTINRQVNSFSILKMHGYEKVYFGDETGRVFRMDTGYTDDRKPIPFILETKRLNQDKPENIKTYRRAYVYTKNGMMANFSYSVDGKEFRTVGRLSKSLSVIELGEARGNDIAFRISQNDSGEGVSLLGISLVYVEGELLNESI